MKVHAVDISKVNISYRTVQPYSVRHNLFRFERVKTRNVHALKDVSFYIEKGEVLGIIGRNGSGKSTLLKALAGIFSPDSGSIDIHGNSVSLLALAAGFQVEATGRENIMLNGLLLGFSEQHIREKMEEIIAFSELGEAIDVPVKTYSSGMRSKLAFSIAANLETDIILIDEILSVGDFHFRKKSYQKMRQIISDATRTAVIVSHQENTLQTLCDRVLWLDQGEIKMIGPAKETIAAYLEYMK